MNLMHGMGGAPRIRLGYGGPSDLMISWLPDFWMQDASEEQELEDDGDRKHRSMLAENSNIKRKARGRQHDI
jgi:hypothetical protein